MKKIFLTLGLAVVSVIGAQAQLLYKISGNGLSAPSYIVGTHHLANVAFIEKIAGVKDALVNTDQVYGELILSDAQKTDSVKAMQKAAQLPQGQTLKTVLTAEQYKKLDNFIINMMGVGLSQPLVAAQFMNLKPAALTTQFVALLYMQNHMSEIDPTSSFDAYFQAQAKKNNETIGGLETLKFQADLLYGSTTTERQVQQLMCLIDNQDWNLQQMEDLLKAFYAQDLDAIEKAFNEKLSATCDATEEEYDALVYNRNAKWAEKMPAIMAEKPTFFAVGVGHMVGEKGVLQLLKNAGYTVEAVQ